MLEFSMTIDLEVQYDEAAKTFTVTKNTVQIKSPEQDNIITEKHQVRFSEHRYGILIIGKTRIGRMLPPNSDVRVIIEGANVVNRAYLGHVHKSALGRIDRVPGIKQFPEGAELELIYIVDKNELCIKQVGDLT